MILLRRRKEENCFVVDTSWYIAIEDYDDFANCDDEVESGRSHKMQWKNYLLHCSLRTLSLECCCSMSIPLLNDVSSCCSETIHINVGTLALIFESFLDGVSLCFLLQF